MIKYWFLCVCVSSSLCLASKPSCLISTQLGWVIQLYYIYIYWASITFVFTKGDRKVSECTVHHCLLHMELHGCTGGLVWWIFFLFFYITWMAGCVCLPGERVAPGFTMGRKQCWGCSVMLWPLFCVGSCHACGWYFDTDHLTKHSFRPCTCFHGDGAPWWLWPLSAE